MTLCHVGAIGILGARLEFKAAWKRGAVPSQDSLERAKQAAQSFSDNAFVRGPSFLFLPMLAIAVSEMIDGGSCLLYTSDAADE